MANLADQITGFVAGDDLDIIRTITGIPTGQTLTKAWLTVKKRASDADGSAVLQKSITTTLTSSGQITDNGAADGVGEVKFTLTPAETALFGPYVTYLFDIQVQTSAGKLYTPNVGTLLATAQVTQATS